MSGPVRAAVRAAGLARAAGLLSVVLGLTACVQDASPRTETTTAHATQNAKTLAHADLAHRLRRFLIARGAPGTPRGQIAADDERFRLGAFWRARTDTHHFGADFQHRADMALAAPGAAPQADAALRQLQATVDARLPAWQALVDYNAAGTMRDDGGDEGRRLLPWAIAALDAIEVATWDYVDAVEAAAPPQ